MKIQLHLKSYHAFYLNNVIIEIQKLCLEELFNSKTQLFLPLQKERYTLLRSPHVDKKSREQFERITHKRLLTFTFNHVRPVNRVLIERLLYGVQIAAVGVEIRIDYIVDL